MGTGLRITDYKAMFSQCRTSPVIVNDILESSGEQKEKLNNLLFTRYTTDLLSNIPTCECGNPAISGEFNVGDELSRGVICPICGTEVTHPIGDLEPRVWIRAPNGVRDLMNPIVWTMLCDRFTKSGFNVIRWLVDVRYTPSVRYPDFMPMVESLLAGEAGFTRSYNYFVDNFDRIMDVLFSINKLRTKSKEVATQDELATFIKGVDASTVRDREDPLRLLILKYRHLIFSRHIPVPNKMLLVVEVNNIGPFMDLNLAKAIDAVRTMVGIDSLLSTHSVRAKENRTVRCLSTLSEFYMEFIKSSISPKEGIARKHIFGCRVHFSFRAVISSITQPHDGGGIEIPWAIGLTVFELHLCNKLRKLGYTPNESKTLIYSHTNTYNSLLDKLLNEIIDECDNAHLYPDGVHRPGVPCTLLRNPSLELGSNPLVRIVKVKTNLNDPTVGISILVVKGLNADFDGDACNFCLALDRYTAKRLSPMLQHRTAFNLENPRTVSGNLSVSKAIIDTFSNFLDNEEVDTCTTR